MDIAVEIRKRLIFFGLEGYCKIIESKEKKHCITNQATPARRV